MVFVIQKFAILYRLLSLQQKNIKNSFQDKNKYYFFFFFFHLFYFQVFKSKFLFI